MPIKHIFGSHFLQNVLVSVIIRIDCNAWLECMVIINYILILHSLSMFCSINIPDVE